MAYKIEERYHPKFWAATMTMTIPEYSSDLYHRALSSLRTELSQSGVELLAPEYNYIITEDHDAKIDLIDLELVVGVKKPGIDTDIVKFKEIEAEDLVLRISSEDFSEIHTGLAEWMHDNDYAAVGSLRRIITDEENFVYDSPVQPAFD